MRDARFIDITLFCQFQGLCSCRGASLARDASLEAEIVDSELETGRNESHPVLLKFSLLSVLTSWHLGITALWNVALLMLCLLVSEQDGSEMESGTGKSF